jgi:hypothetical protein
MLGVHKAGSDKFPECICTVQYLHEISQSDSSALVSKKVMTGELATKRMEKTTLLALRIPTTEFIRTSLHRWKGTRADRELWHCPERKEEPWIAIELALVLRSTGY